MRKLKIVILSFVGALLFVLGSSQIALSVVIYDDNSDGYDFPNSLTPDPSNIIVLNVGTNTILGTTTYQFSGINDYDAIRFTIPEGMSLSEIDISLTKTGMGTVTNYTLSLYSFDSSFIYSQISTWESGSPPVSNNSAFSDVLPLPPGNYAILDTELSGSFSEGQSAALHYTIDINVTGTSESFTCDVDGDGTVQVGTDALLIIRYVFGFRGATLIDNAIGSGATRTTAAEIEAYIVDAIASLEIDVDGDGSAQVGTDALLIIRYVFGFRGATLIDNAIGPGATRTTAAEIEAYILSIVD